MGDRPDKETGVILDQHFHFSDTVHYRPGIDTIENLESLGVVFVVGQYIVPVVMHHQTIGLTDFHATAMPLT